MTAVLELPVTCSGATHRVEVRVDARQRVRCVLHDHDQVVEEVLEALGGTATACSRAGSALRALRGHIPTVADRVEWVRIGVTDPREYEGWQKASVHSPRVAKRWLRLVSEYEARRVFGAIDPASKGPASRGSASRDPASKTKDTWISVLAWKLNGFATPTAAAPWARAGCHPNTARQWVEDGVTVDGARSWIDHGVHRPEEAIGWRALGVVEPEETTVWTAAGVESGFDAQLWSQLGVTAPDEVVRWLATGSVSADDVLTWKRAGIGAGHGHLPGCEQFHVHGPDQVADWLRSGLSSYDARGWLAAGHRLPGGIIPADTERWKATGVHTGASLKRWASIGVTRPEDVADWIHAGVTDERSAADWSRAGVRSLEDLARWLQVGITSSEEARSWVEPVFVTCIEEVGAWRAARCRNADWALLVLGKGDKRVPEDVWTLRAHQLEFLQGTWTANRVWNGRPGQVLAARWSAHPAAVLTERYFYALGHRCRAEVATDVIEQDFDASGGEVSRIRRPWFPDGADQDALGGGGDGDV